MLLISLILFAAVLVVLAASVARGLLRITDILEIVDTGESDVASPRASVRTGS